MVHCHKFHTWMCLSHVYICIEQCEIILRKSMEIPKLSQSLYHQMSSFSVIPQYFQQLNSWKILKISWTIGILKDWPIYSLHLAVLHLLKFDLWLFMWSVSHFYITSCLVLENPKGKTKNIGVREKRVEM